MTEKVEKFSKRPEGPPPTEEGQGLLYISPTHGMAFKCGSCGWLFKHKPGCRKIKERG